MAVELRAYSDALCDMGNRLADHGESLLALQRASHDDATGAHSGWVGSSANALTELLDRWATVSGAHVGRFGEHSCGMHFAAAGLTEMEQTNAASLR